MDIFKKIKKTIALLIYYSFAKYFPTQPMPGYRFGYFLRRHLLMHIAENCGSDIIVKHNASIGSGTGLRIGNRSQIGHNAKIGQHITIGDDVLMGPDVVIMANTHAFDNLNMPINLQGSLPIEPVTIGNDVWLGTRVIILPGVNIGDKTVIGAGSVVTKDMPSGVIAAGNPASVIRKRGASNPKKEEQNL